MRSVRPSPARVEAPEPGAWLPILDVTDAIARSEAIYALVQAEVSTDSLEVQFSGGLDLIELERPSALAALAEASDLIESDFWSTSGAEFDLAVANPELVGFAPPRAFDGASTSAAGLKSGSNVEHLKDADSSSRVLEGSAKSYSALAKRSLRIKHAATSLSFMVGLVLVALLGSRIFGAQPPVRYVSVAVDGESSTIETRGRSVSDALAAANVELGKHDRVLPSASTPLTDETNVRVLRSFPVILDFDGTTRRVQT
ncbi:MAG: ubiquitin-like domain-containing protein, partial [Acidimicrobiia bacterium]|nr:ubiquitin-like domain-containing protein [Acidimicrobiia bacterium]